MGGEFSLLSSIRGRILRRAVREANWAQLAVAVVFLVLGAAVFIGAFLAYRESFVRMLFEPLAGSLIARYILDSGFALILFLGVISFVAGSVGMFYRDREIGLLFSLPLDPWQVFLHRFTGATAMASWPVVLLGLPAVIALGSVLRVSPFFYIAGAAVLLLFALFIAVIGGILSFLMAWTASKVRSSWVWAAETVLSVVALLWLIRRMIPRSIFTLFNVNDLTQATAAGQRLSALFDPIPSHHFVDLFGLALPFSVSGLTPTAIALKLTAIVVALLAVLAFLAYRFYLPLWRRHQEGGFLAQPDDVPDRPARRPFPRFLHRHYSYLFEKEVLVLGRDQEALARTGFILFLLALYLTVAAGLSRLDDFVTAENFSLLTTFTFAVIGYFSLTLCLRFAFPSLSLEGKSAWIIWSSPMHLHELYSWKLYFWTAVVALPMETAVVFTAVSFGLPPALWLFLAYAAACTSIALVSIALGQGFLFPNFHDPNADSLVTSPAGLGATALGLAYLWIAGSYVHQFALIWLERQQPDFNSCFGLLIVTLAVLVAFWILAPRRLERTEIV